MLRLAALLLLPLALGPAAAAQSMAVDAAPAYGTLAPGAEAASVDVVARGTVDMPAGPAAEGCVGFVDPSAPDAVVEWGGGTLRVWTRAAFDPTLAVAGPDGAWSCNDDFDGLLPVVEVDDAPAGRYAVWVGTFSPDPSTDAATLYAGPPPPPPVLDPSAPALAGRIAAAGGFETEFGAIDVAVQAGGPDPAEALEMDGEPAFCAGYIEAGRPTAIVDYDAAGGTGTLAIAAASFDTDLTLVVQAPDGALACNDDFDGLDPLVAFEDAASGAYAVWVGTFGALQGTADATLSLSETVPEFDFGFDPHEGVGGPYSEGSYTVLDLGATPPVTISADEAGGEGSAAVLVRPTEPNPVQGFSCAGSLETAPTAAVRLSGEGPFAVRATGDDDLLLTLRTPGGAWFCSDDADGLDPGIQIDTAEAGDYLVWVGAFLDDGSAVEGTLSAAPGEVAYEMIGEVHGETQSDGVYDGDAIGGAAAATLVPGAEADVLAGGPVLNPVEGDACAGFISAAPTAAVEGGDMLRVEASSGTDLTLVVRAPDGSWVCSDDAGSRDPAADVTGGPGTYEIWVGTFSRRDEPVPATLRLSE